MMSANLNQAAFDSKPAAIGASSLSNDDGAGFHDEIDVGPAPRYPRADSRKPR